MQVETTSKCETAYRLFEERIRSGVWPVGYCMPTELELAAESRCGRNTISQAITKLVHEGLVERRKRAGTRVIRSTSSREASSINLDAFAFIYPSDKHENIWRIAQGFQGEANLKKRRAIMFATGPDFRKEAEIISRLVEFDIRGAVIYPATTRPEEEASLLQMLASSKFPLVLIGQPTPGSIRPAVAVDGFHIGYTMTRHLIGVGSTRIGFLANNAHEQGRRDMHKGYLWAMEEAKLPTSKERLLLEMSMHPNFEDPLREPTALGHSYLKKAKDVEAVVCADDHLALGLMIAAQERGLRIPKDLKITGNDDLPSAATSHPALTTYRISPEAVGRTAFQILTEYVATPGEAPLSVTVRGELIVRESA